MKSILVSLAVLACFVPVNPTFAQTGNASVTGIIQDSTQANIPGVTVTATNTQTGVVTKVLSNESGTYNLLSLLPGTYRLSAELTGFRPQIYNSVELGTGVTLRYNFTLQVGVATDAVEVTVAGGNALLQESSASIGQVLAGAQVRDLPLIGNDVLSLISVMGGVRGAGSSPATTFAGIGAGMVNTVRDGLSVNDGRYLDGVFSSTVINPEMVAEMRVILTPVDAEMGRGNGQVQISTRSGTNRYTGSAVWTIHNSAMDANTWTNNNRIVNGVWTPTVPNWVNKNEWTVSYGGPILKNKTFFFALAEGQIFKTRATQRPVVLTPCASRGIFRYYDGWVNGNALTTTSVPGTANATTAVVDSFGNPLQPATNPNGSPFTGSLHFFSVFGPLASNPVKPDCSDATLQGGSWDSNRTGLDSTGLIQKYLDAMPTPNRYDGGDGLNTAVHEWQRGTNSSGSLAIGAGTDADTDRKQINIKVDHNINANNKVSVNWSYQRADGGNALTTWPTGYGGVTMLRPQVFTVNFTTTLSASLINEARFGMRRGSLVISPAWEQTADAKAHDVAQSLLVQGSQNFPIAFVPSSVGAMVPSSYVCLSPAISGCAQQGNQTPLYNYADTLSWAKSKHTFKVGVDIRHSYSRGWASPTAPIPSSTGGGGLNANQAFQNAANFPNLVASNQTVANQLLYFLSGSVTSAQQVYFLKDSQDLSHWEDYNSADHKYLNVVQNEWAAFVKDDWKILPSLTLNLGLRYEYYGVPYEGAGLGTVPVGGSDALFGVSGRNFTNWMRPDNGVDLNLATTQEFVGPKTTNPSKALYKNDWNNIGPAIGFAWAVPWFGKGETNVRGGYQITYSGGGQAQPIDNFILSNPGFQNIATANAPADGSYYSLVNLPGTVPVPTSVLPMQPIPVQKQNQPIAVYNSRIATPYVQNFTLSVTRDVRRNLNVDVRYIGTRGMKLWGNFDLNVSNVFNNPELFDALTRTRRGEDAPLFDKMFMGLNLNPGTVGCNPAAPTTTCAPVNGTTQTGSAHLRLSSTFRTALANGDFNTVANALNIFNGTGTGASGAVSGAGGERGTVLKRANLGFNVPGGTTIAGGPQIQAGLFPANWINVNPQFSTASLYSDSGSSVYHSLQVQATLRASHGISYQGTYVFSKSLGVSASTYTNPAEREKDYTLSATDQRHGFRSNGTFQLPFGPNQLILGQSTGILARIVERWQSSVIFNLSSGTPVSITAGNMLYALGVPDVVAPLDLRTGNVLFPDASATNSNNGSYFAPGTYSKVTDPQCNAVAVSLQPLCTLTAVSDAKSGQILLQNPSPGNRGTLGQKTMEGPGTWSLDANLSKSFRISESKSLQFRLDATNVTNHPGINAPSLSLTNNNNFGLITGKNNDHRVFQAQLHFMF